MIDIKFKKPTIKYLKKEINEKYNRIKGSILSKLWLEVFFMIDIALLSTVLVFLTVSHFTYSTKIGIEEHISYQKSMSYMQNTLLEKVAEISAIEDDIQYNNEKAGAKINEILSEDSFSTKYVQDTQSYLVDSTGRVMFQENIINSLNLIKVIEEANKSQYIDSYNKFKAIYPVIIQGKVYYLYNQSRLQPFYYKEFTDAGNVLGIFAGIGVLILIVFNLTKGKVAYICYLSRCLREISNDNLDYKIDIVGNDELAEVARSIMEMEAKLKSQIRQKMKAEKTKNELVTNVAHDLRTPLTSIIGYIELLKDDKALDENTRTKYLEIVHNKASSLKNIIEDLFELTKLHQETVKLDKSYISLGDLINQLVEELIPLANKKEIHIECYIEAEDTTVYVDVTKIARVFQNLIENAIKYCPDKESIYIEVKAKEENLYIAISNPYENVSQEEIDKFFSRFYRKDESRSSSIKGSGLGLAIVKDILRLHDGIIEATMVKDLISFKIKLPRKV